MKKEILLFGMERFVCGGACAAERISSRSNPRVVRAAGLKDRRNRESERAFLCEGIKLTGEALAFGRVREVFVREDALGLFDEMLGGSLPDGVGVFVLSAPAFEKISTERSPQGVISVADYPENYSLWDGEVPEGGILMLESVMDPGNVGTVLRSAAAFGCGSVVLSRCADVFGPKTVRGAMGALFKQRIIRADDGEGFVRALREKGRRALAATLGESALSLGGYETIRDDCVIIGNEGHGICDEVTALCTDRVFIPMDGNTESLNAAVAAAVILWEYYKNAERDR